MPSNRSLVDPNFLEHLRKMGMIIPKTEVAQMPRKASGVKPKKPEWMTQAYQDYLASENWKRKRMLVILRDGKKCRFCGDPGITRNKEGKLVNPLEVDHNSYPDPKLPYAEAIKQFETQSIDDMLTLCRKCHRSRTRKTRSNRNKFRKKTR